MTNTGFENPLELLEQARRILAQHENTTRAGRLYEDALGHVRDAVDLVRAAQQAPPEPTTTEEAGNAPDPSLN